MVKPAVTGSLYGGAPGPVSNSGGTQNETPQSSFGCQRMKTGSPHTRTVKRCAACHMSRRVLAALDFQSHPTFTEYPCM
jgi:hypothetical protein